MKRKTSLGQIDLEKTGHNIQRLCREKKLSVTDIQEYLHINSYQSIYNWFYGKTLPSIDNLYALSKLLKCKIDDIIISSKYYYLSEFYERNSINYSVQNNIYYAYVKGV